jgi:hypothetical protein
VRFESHPEPLYAGIRRGFERAVDDTLDLARVHAERHAKSGTFARSLSRTATQEVDGRLTARIGSPLASARVKERGGYMEARQHIPKFGPYLAVRLPDGSVRKASAVRVRATPVVTPAGARWPVILPARLREQR